MYQAQNLLQIKRISNELLKCSCIFHGPHYGLCTILERCQNEHSKLRNIYLSWKTDFSILICKPRGPNVDYGATNVRTGNGRWLHKYIILLGGLLNNQRERKKNNKNFEQSEGENIQALTIVHKNKCNY